MLSKRLAILQRNSSTVIFFKDSPNITNNTATIHLNSNGDLNLVYEHKTLWSTIESRIPFQELSDDSIILEPPFKAKLLYNDYESEKYGEYFLTLVDSNDIAYWVFPNILIKNELKINDKILALADNSVNYTYDEDYYDENSHIEEINDVNKI